MEEYALAPLLTEKDEAESAEGGIDPLGTDPLADALAVQLVPGVRERQRHPRFLTAMAVSLHVCQDFEEEALASDGVSEPWQVFEWYLVEGLVRKGEVQDRTGLPGSAKGKRAFQDKVPLSAKRYLKTPTVFGFHGVYRQLARTLGVDDHGRLGDNGSQLLSVWAREQDLGGFLGTGNGLGNATCKQLREAVEAGLKKGATDRCNGWVGWDFFWQHLQPYDIGVNEADFITALLLRDAKGHRGRVISFLTSPEGQRAWNETKSERQFHQVLRAAATDEDLRRLLDAIAAYETFSRLCHDAFQDCLLEMTRQGGKKTSPSTLAALESVRTASQKVPEIFGEVAASLEPVDKEARFHETFASLAEHGGEQDWVERLLEHHRKTQRQKPPTCSICASRSATTKSVLL